MIYDRIKTLCKENNISVNSLEKMIGVARGSLCKIDDHKPSSEKIQKIAEVLNSSVDYLTTGKELAKTDVALSNMNKRLKEYAIKLSNLSKEKQEQIINLIDELEKNK